MNKMLAPPSEINTLWTYGHVAHFLGVSLSKAKRLPIPCVRLGRSVRFFPDRVREWAAAHSVPRQSGETYV